MCLISKRKLRILTHHVAQKYEFASGHTTLGARQFELGVRAAIVELTPKKLADSTPVEFQAQLDKWLEVLQAEDTYQMYSAYTEKKWQDD